MKQIAQNGRKVHDDHTRAKISERAYFIALAQGFPDGCELIHWLQAEEQILRELEKTSSKAVVQTSAKGASKPAAKASAKKPATVGSKAAGKAKS